MEEAGGHTILKKRTKKEKRFAVGSFYISWIVASYTVIDFATGNANAPFMQGFFMVLIVLTMWANASGMRQGREEEIRAYAETRNVYLEAIEHFDEEIALLDENHLQANEAVLAQRGWWMSHRDHAEKMLEEVDKRWRS